VKILLKRKDLLEKVLLYKNNLFRSWLLSVLLFFEGSVVE